MDRCPREVDNEGGMFCYQHKCYEMPEQDQKVIIGEIVYFVVAPSENVVKIGKTTNLKRRFEGLRNMSPVPVELARSIEGPVGSEASFHSHYEKYRKHGEWFELGTQLESDILFAPDEELCRCIEGYDEWMNTGRFKNPTWRWWALSQAAHLKLIPLAQRKPWECDPWEPVTTGIGLNGA